MTDAWNTVPWLDWHWWKTTSVLNKYWADKLCFFFSHCSSLFLHFFFLQKKNCSQLADWTVPRSCHHHQAQYLFSLQHKICSQITTEPNTDNVSPRSRLPRADKQELGEKPIKWSLRFTQWPTNRCMPLQTGSHTAAFHSTRKCVIDVVENKVRKK